MNGQSSFMTILCSAMVVTPYKLANFGDSFYKIHRRSSSELTRGSAAIFLLFVVAFGISVDALSFLRAGVRNVSSIGSTVVTWLGHPFDRHDADFFSH